MATLSILIDAQDRATREIRNLQRQLAVLNSQVRANIPAANGAAAANVNLANSFRSAATAGSGLSTVLVGLGGIALFVNTVRTIGQFEQSLAQARAVIIDTTLSAEEQEDQFQSLSDRARELGASTVFSASQAADGLAFLGRAGFSVNEALGAIEGTLNLAAAGSLDLARAADIASNVLSGFGLAASEAGRVADVLALAAQSSNTNVEQLGEAFKFVAPVAAAFGVSIEESGAALGLLGNAGLQASTAGTGLRRVLATLGTPTSKLNDLLGRLGLQFDQVNPATNDLTDVLELLASRGISAADALNVFGQRGAPAILAITSQIGDLRDFNGALEDAGGTAETTAGVLTDTLFGSLKELRSAFEELLLQVGEGGLGGGLRDLVETVTGVVRVFTGALDPLDENAVLYRQIAAAVESLRFVIVALVATRIVGFLGNIGTSLFALRGQAQAATVGLTGLTRAAVGLRTVILGALGPLGWIVGIGLALLSLADNEAEAANQKLQEIDATLKLIDATSEDLTLGQIEKEAELAEAKIAKLNEQIANTDRLLEEQRRADAGGLRQGGSTFGFDETGGDVAGGGELGRLRAEELRAQQQRIRDQIEVEQAGLNRLNEIREQKREENAAAEKKQADDLAKLNADRIQAELAAETAITNQKQQEALKQLELAKSTADEIAAITKAGLDIQLADGEISIEQYYARLEELALANADREIGITRQKIETQEQLNRDALISLDTQQAQAEGAARGTAELEQIRATFEARRRATLANQATELLDLRNSLAEQGLAREQIVAENNLKLNQALQKQRDKEAADNKKARDEDFAARRAEIDRRIGLVELERQREIQAAGRDAAAGAISPIEEGARIQQAALTSRESLIGLRQELIELNREAQDPAIAQQINGLTTEIINFADTANPVFEELNNQLVEGLADGFLAVIEGTKSAEEAFSQLARSFLRQIAQMILQQIVLNALKASGFGFSGGGAVGGSGGGLIGAAKGGLIKAAEGGFITGKGTATSDSIPARLSNGEYVVQAKAVNAYGLRFMEAINRMKIPPQKNLPKFAITRPKRTRFADGGFVESTGAQKIDPEQATQQSSLRLVNVVDTNEASNYLGSSDGESMIVNIIRRNGSQIKQLLR